VGKFGKLGIKLAVKVKMVSVAETLGRGSCPSAATAANKSKL